MFSKFFNQTPETSSPAHISAGNQAEHISEQLLINNGLTTIETNYRTRLGEIDLIMLDNNSLVFIEVRLRTNQFVSAVETINLKKQQKIIKAAQFFLQNNKKFASCPCRFDVVALDSLDITSANWIKDAFQL